MSKSAIKNGEIIREEDALLPITLREVQCNYSVYEALRVLGGKAVHLADHEKRLRESASMLKMDIPDLPLEDWIAKLVRHDGLSDVTMRILVVGGKAPQVFITYQELLTYPDSYYEEGVAVTTYEGERFMPTCKTSNLLLSYLALNDAREKGAFEALLVDRNSEVLEGTRSNFYALKDGMVYTADSAKVLSGVTRISVLKALEEMGIPVVLKAPTVKDIEKCDALFISSTSM
ncbi:MAG: aminotransferase class IV, partial [Bullifex sp.]